MQSNKLINQHTKITCSKCWKCVWFCLGQPLSHDNVMWICVMKYETMLLQTKRTKNSQWSQLLSAVVDPEEGPYYYFQIKLRPKEPKNTFGDPPPPLLSEGLDLSLISLLQLSCRASGVVTRRSQVQLLQGERVFFFF